MTPPIQQPVRVAIACGGTGGPLFPGLAVAEQLTRHGCAVTLLVSPKEVDQQAVRQARSLSVMTLPAIGLTPGRRLAFVKGFVRSYRAARQAFAASPLRGALAMGGFTSAPPILAAKRLGAWTFLHESNTIPGRANRWLARLVNQAFVGFPATANRLRHCQVTVTGTPVRPQFEPRDAGSCRRALGLDPGQPVVLVMGGSQGASAVNALVTSSLSILARLGTQWQWLHLTGPVETEQVRQAYAALSVPAQVHSFFQEMELALGAATVAISRAGASSLAELAAVRVPAILVPYPTAVDNHQLHNARSFEEAGAARVLEQKTATPMRLAQMLIELVQDARVREQMQGALARCHTPRAAEQIAAAMLRGMGVELVEGRTTERHEPFTRTSKALA